MHDMLVLQILPYKLYNHWEKKNVGENGERWWSTKHQNKKGGELLEVFSQVLVKWLRWVIKLAVISVQLGSRSEVCVEAHNFQGAGKTTISLVCAQEAWVTGSLYLKNKLK